MHKKIYILMMFLGACSVGPDYQKTDVFENAQIAQVLQLKGTSISVSKKWYENFEDENLNGLIADALAQNSDVLSAIEKLKQARTAAKIANVQYLPMLNFKGGYDYTKASKNIALSADTDYFSIGFDANWELDVWGVGRRLSEQKKAEFESAYYSLKNIQNVMTAEVASTYFTYQTLNEKHKIALNNLALQRDIFKTIEEKYQAGLAEESAYHQSSYLLEKTKALIPALEAQMKAATNALAVLTGRLADTFGDKLKVKSNPLRRAYKYDLKTLFDLPADIIRTRPDVKAAEKALVAQNAAIGQAVGALYPNVSVSALFGFGADHFSDLIKSSSKTYGYNPSSVMPLFYWGELQNKVNLEKEKMAEVYQNYKKILLSSVEELANAIIAVQKEYQANRSYQNAAGNMQKAYLAMKEKYDNGLIEYATLLEVQQDLLDAQTNLADSNGAIYQKIIAFYKATGGGYNEY